MRYYIFKLILSLAVAFAVLPGAPLTVSASSNLGNISGAVTDGAAPVQGVEVYAYETATGDSSTAAVTDVLGNYLLTGLTPGSYKVFFNSYWLRYSNQWYGNTTDLSAAALLVVLAGNTTANINAALTAGSGISGAVNDNTGIGIQNISVYVYDAENPYICYSITRTDADGKYTAKGVPTSRAKVIFGNYGTDDYTSNWYNDKTEWATATHLEVSAPNATQEVNAVLTTGGGISGKITDASGNPVPNTTVMIYAADNNCSTINNCSTSVRTDVSGNYSYKGLRTGTYKLEFSNWPTYSNGFYSNGLNLNTATTVVVTATDTTTDINTTLFKRGASNCTATLKQRDNTYYLNMPVLKYENSGTKTFYHAELKFNSLTDARTIARVTSNTGLLTDTLPYFDCQPSLLYLSGSGLNLHITNIEFNNAYYWADLTYLESAFFLLTDFGPR